MEPHDPPDTTPAARATSRPLRLELSAELSSKKPLVAYQTDSDQEDAPNTPSTSQDSTALVRIQNSTADLPSTPTFAVETKSCSAGIKRKRVHSCSGDTDDKDQRAKSRFITLDNGGLGFDSLIASYIASATESVYRGQDKLRSDIEDLRRSQADASSKSKADLLTLGEEHTKKHDDHTLKTKQLTQRVATVEYGTSDIRKLHDHTTTKLQQLEHDIGSKALKVDVDQHIKDQDERNKNQDELLKKHDDLFKSHDSRILHRVTQHTFNTQVVKEKEALETAIAKSKSEFEEKLKATSAVADKARLAGTDCCLKLEKYRNEANKEITDGLKGLNDTLALLGKDVTVLQGDVTALQLRTDNHEKALLNTATKGNVIDLIAPTRKNLETLEGRHAKLSGNVKVVETKTDTMQQSIATLDTQTKFFQEHLKVTVPETSGAIKSLTSRVEALEQKDATKAETTTLTTQKASPQTSAEFSEKGLLKQERWITEDRKLIADLNIRIDNQDMEISTLKQTREQVEADNKQLRTDFEAEKLRTNQAFDFIQALTIQMAAFKSQMFPPAVENAPAKSSSESERRRSLHVEAQPKSATDKKLHERLDSLWNKVVANETLADARFNKVERITNQIGPRVDSLESVTDHGGLRIDKLQEDMKNWFESALTGSDADFRRNQNAFENALTRSGARMDSNIRELMNALSTAKAAVEARVEEHEERFKTTDAVLGRLDHHVVGLETEKSLIQAALKSSSASIEVLNERVSKSESSHEAASQASTAASAKLDTLDTRMTDFESTYNAAQQAPTTITSPISRSDLDKLRTDLDKLIARHQDDQIGCKNFERNKARITALEKKFDEINNAQSAFAAGCVTSEQMNGAVAGLKLSLETKIKECKSNLEKAIGIQDWHADQRCHDGKGGVKQVHDKWIEEHYRLHHRLIGPTSTSASQALLSAYPSPPQHNPAVLSPGRPPFPGTTPASRNSLPHDGRAPQPQKIYPMLRNQPHLRQLPP